jgi:hypothetical protein
MIFHQYRVFCDDFDDCHDEIAIVGSAGGQVVAIMCKGTGASGRPQQRLLLRLIDLIVVGCREEIKELKVMNLHPTLLPTMQLSIFFHRFRYVLDWFRSVGSCGISNVLGLVTG